MVTVPGSLQGRLKLGTRQGGTSGQMRKSSFLKRAF